MAFRIGRRWVGAFIALPAIVSATLALRGCGAPVVNTSNTGVITGRVTYERREPDPAAPEQLMATPVVRPAVGRPVVVALASGSGVAFARTLTDASGRYTLRVPEQVALTVSCLAARAPGDRSDGAGFELYDPGVEQAQLEDDLPWNVSGAVTVTVSATVDLSAQLSAQGGAFAIAETLDRSIAVAATYGWISASQPMPVPRVYWRRGLDSFLGTAVSFFLPWDEFPIMFIQSFATGFEATGTADEWNPCTVLHEHGHCLMHYRTKDDNPGGMHYFVDEDPRLAWGEGLGYFWAAVASGEAAVVSRRGFGASGTFESYFPMTDYAWWPVLPPLLLCSWSGLYCELSIATMLVAACDGVGTSPPDVDFDPLDGRGATVFSILRSPGYLRNHPFLTFNDFAREWQLQSPGDFADLVTIMNGQGMSSWPPVVPPDQWPTALAAPATVTGSCSSAFMSPETAYPNGALVSSFYRITLATAANINLTLTITGTGAPPQNLDLRLYDESGTRVAQSESVTNPTESISYAAPRAGQYLVQVRAPMVGAATNTAGFTLSYSN